MEGRWDAAGLSTGVIWEVIEDDGGIIIACEGTAGGKGDDSVAVDIGTIGGSDCVIIAAGREGSAEVGAGVGTIAAGRGGCVGSADATVGCRGAVKVAELSCLLISVGLVVPKC